jgi:hypothetical protein
MLNQFARKGSNEVRREAIRVCQAHGVHSRASEGDQGA